MGIDALDLHFRVEKAFRISLSIEEMRSLMRDDDLYVGDLYDYLLKKLTLRDRARYDVHLNYELWRDVQRTLQVVTNQPMEEIALDTQLEELFLPETRRIDWGTLKEKYPHLPKLELPMTVLRATGWGSLGLTICLLAAALWVLVQLRLGWLWLFLLLPSTSMILKISDVLLFFCASKRTNLPPRMRTVKDLCRVLLASNYTQICQQGEVSVDKKCLEVWHKLQGILHEVLRVELEKITFQSGMIRDLGMS